MLDNTRKMFHKILNFIYKRVNHTAIYRFYKSCRKTISHYIELFRIYVLHDKNYIRLKPTGFWSSDAEGISHFPAFVLLNKKIVVTEKHPQLQLCSVKKLDSCKTFFYTGEEVSHNFSAYSDYLMDIADFSSGFKYEDEFSQEEQKHYLRYPLWIAYNYGFYSTDKDFIKKYIDEFETQRLQVKKTLFCALIARHDRWSGGIRTALYEAIKTIGPINCPSKFLHNDDSLTTKFNDNKIEYLKQFRFNICAENYSTRGYITEKVFDAFRTGSIPVYSGGGVSLIEPEVVNQNAIIRYDGTNIDEVIEKSKNEQ